MKHTETHFEEDLQHYVELLSQDFDFSTTEVNIERGDINNHKARYPISKPNQWLHDMLEKELGLPVEYEYALDGYSTSRLINLQRFDVYCSRFINF